MSDFFCFENHQPKQVSNFQQIENTTWNLIPYMFAKFKSASSISHFSVRDIMGDQWVKEKTEKGEKRAENINIQIQFVESQRYQI